MNNATSAAEASPKKTGSRQPVHSAGGVSRRDFLRMAGLSAAGLGAGVAPQAQAKKAAPAAVGRARKPNIIFIMADDLAYGELGCYGQEKIKTPRIDAMAAEGTRFTHAYSGSPVCAPARCVLMTGLHTGHCRIRNNGPMVGGVLEYIGEGTRRLSIDDRDRTVAECLSEAGYVTGAFGKWGLSEPGTAGTPNRRGFHEWFGYLNQNHAANYYPDHLWRNEEKQMLPENFDDRKGAYSHDLLTDEALSFVRRHRERPFFLYLPYTIPHKRHEVPDLGEYADKPWSEDAKIYAAMISRMDRDVGRVIDEVERLGLAEDTLIVFTSDNGEIKRLPWDDDFFRSSAHLREKKSSLYEGGIRIPMVVRWPGVVPSGRVSDVPWYFADVYPTCLRLAGERIHGGLDGIDVTDILCGTSNGPEERYMYWEISQNRRLWQAVRRGRWKGLRLGMDGPLELYDLATDESETRDVAVGHPEVVRDLERFLTASHVPSENWPVR